MSISAINTNNIATILDLQTLPESTKVKSNSLNELSDEFFESNETSKFKEIVSKYDITNLSRNEANLMYNELYDNGLISLADMSLTTFDPTNGIDWEDGYTLSGATVSSDDNAKTNLLEQLKTQAEWNKKYGDCSFQNIFDKNLELAEKIAYFQS